MNTTAPRISGVPGVTWNRHQRAWLAQWRRDGETFTRSFSISKFGEVGALEQAIKLRIAMEAKYMRKSTKPNPPVQSQPSPPDTQSVSMASEDEVSESTASDAPQPISQPTKTLEQTVTDKSDEPVVINNTFNISGCKISFFSAFN